MTTINQIKEQRQTDTPLLLFRCVLPSGDVERWSTHQTTYNSELYSARVLQHNLFDLQLSADDAMDGISQISISLANADSQLSELNAAVGFKGSQLTVYFAFADLRIAAVTTESTVLFRGVAGDPDEITERALTLSFVNKLSLQRIPVPDVRIQRSCSWNFPASYDQRVEARDGDSNGLPSRYYRCGYSADLPFGSGNLIGGEAYVACDKSRTQCEARGMFDKDATGNATGRFGGFEFVPSAIAVRTAGDKSSHTSPLLTNSAKYNDPVPIIYGTGWLRAPVIFARNDGNLTHMEVLIGMGPITGIMKVVVDDVEIPQGVSSTDMTATGWYMSVSRGDRSGLANPDFQDQNAKPLGDPHGSMATLSVVVPNRISSGTSLPTIEVLLQGLQIDTYDPTATVKTTEYSNNPAWIILDLLKRCGWPLQELNLGSFVKSAAYCGYLITTSDLNGNPIQVPRFECNLILTKRQSAASLVRGIRVAASLMLRYGANGLLELQPEATLTLQQPSMPDGSNSTQELDGGFPAYEFSDASDRYSGILRNADGSSSVRLTSRSIAECSNRLSVEFQDATNEYQQDSLSLVDNDDSALIGYEISSQSTALGITNFSQATRVLLRQLDKLTKGNLFVQFQTSFRALKVRPGDIIALTYLKEGFERTPFRVVRLSPATNYETVDILAQLHNDDWYSDDPGVLGGSGRQPGSGASSPRPLVGTVKIETAGPIPMFDFGITEELRTYNDGTAVDRISVSFSQPLKQNIAGTSIPLVSLSPSISAKGGSLKGGATYYYAFTALNSSGQEGQLSFTVPARIPDSTNENTVSITALSFPTTAEAFNVYRGSSPQIMYCVARNLPLSDSFTDTGLPVLPIGPPDPNFDHANFYYRYEYAGPIKVSSADQNMIAFEDFEATEATYSGMVVVILSGSGQGQERVIAGNSSHVLNLVTPWTKIPDSSSVFAICEGSWHFAAVSATSPVQFEVPYREGAVIRISGRGATVHNREGSPNLCPMTRVVLGKQAPDSGAPATPSFFLDSPGAGVLALTQIGFPRLANIGSVSSGTLQLYYWDELRTPSPMTMISISQSPFLLPDGTVAQMDTIQIGGVNAREGDFLQIGQELILLGKQDSLSNSFIAYRGVLGSSIQALRPGDQVLQLTRSVITTSFAPGFFENASSVNFIHSFVFPDVRVVAAEFFVTNAFGDSQVQVQRYVSNPDGGLRTLSGGQVSLQLSGYLSNQLNAVPGITIEKKHAVRDLRATLAQPASGYRTFVDVMQDGEAYCRLQIEPGKTLSEPGGSSLEVFGGAGLAPLAEGSNVTIDVTLSQVDGTAGPVVPGKDLTVTIRF